VDLTNPQSWNRYAYVGNSPTSFVDPSGLVRNPCTNAGCILGGGGGSCAFVDPMGQVTTVTLDGLDAGCNGISSLLNTGGISSITGLPPNVFTPGGGTCELHGWTGEETWYECSGNIFAPPVAANNAGKTPRICGGTFEFGGLEADVAEGGAFTGVIHEHDSIDGNLRCLFLAGCGKMNAGT
jgi:hypothetical protein